VISLDVCVDVNFPLSVCMIDHAISKRSKISQSLMFSDNYFRVHLRVVIGVFLCTFFRKRLK
jgi:hypothetical protein